MNEETITLDDTSTVEILFIDKSGSYRALYTHGNLTSITTQSSSDVLTELDFTLMDTFTHLKALGFEEGEGGNSFTITPPSEQDPVIRFEFTKGDTDE